MPDAGNGKPLVPRAFWKHSAIYTLSLMLVAAVAFWVVAEVTGVSEEIYDQLREKAELECLEPVGGTLYQDDGCFGWSTDAAVIQSVAAGEFILSLALLVIALLGLAHAHYRPDSTLPGMPRLILKCVLGFVALSLAFILGTFAWFNWLHIGMPSTQPAPPRITTPAPEPGYEGPGCKSPPKYTYDCPEVETGIPRPRPSTRRDV